MAADVSNGAGAAAGDSLGEGRICFLNSSHGTVALMGLLGAVPAVELAQN